MKKSGLLSLAILLIPFFSFCAALKNKQDAIDPKSVHKIVRSQMQKGIPLEDMIFDLSCGEEATVLDIAAYTGDPELAEEVFQNPQATNALINRAINSSGNPPLFQAIAQRHFKMVQPLLNNKASVEQRNALRMSPLIEAVAQNDGPCVKTLLPYATPQNIADSLTVANIPSSGVTPGIKMLLRNHLRRPRIQVVELVEVTQTPPAAAEKPGRNTKKKKQKRKKAKQDQQQDPLVSAKKEERTFRKNEDGKYAPKPEEEEFLRQLERQMSLGEPSAEEVKN